MVLYTAILSLLAISFYTCVSLISMQIYTLNISQTIAAFMILGQNLPKQHPPGQTPPPTKPPAVKIP